MKNNSFNAMTQQHFNGDDKYPLNGDKKQPQTRNGHSSYAEMKNNP